MVTNRGSVSNLSILIVIIVITFAMTYLAKSLTELRLVEFRADAYLCAKHSLKRTSNFHRNIVYANRTIITINLLMPLFAALPPKLAILRFLKKITQGIQEVLRVIYLAQISFQSKCSLGNTFHLMINNPTHGKLTLERNKISGTVKMRKKWQSYLFFIPKTHLKPIENAFYIDLYFQADGSALKTFTKEVNTKVLQHWKQAYGLLSSAQSALPL